MDLRKLDMVGTIKRRHYYFILFFPSFSVRHNFLLFLFSFLFFFETQPRIPPFVFAEVALRDWFFFVFLVSS